ncbi:MAG: MCE family protein, partial [Candidatus Manganitrophaceae bacterium]
MKMHYSHRLSLSQIERIVGLFVLIPLILVVVVAIIIGRNRELFEEKYHVTTTFKEGYGLEPGVPVVVSGIRIGQVASVRFNAENQVDVNLELLKKHREKVRLNSVASISRSGFVVGDKRILVTIGSPKLPVIENGGRLAGKDPFEIEQMIEVVMPTIENLQKMIGHLEKTTAEFPQLVETSQRSLEHVEEIVAKVDQVADALPSYAASGRRSLKNVEKVTEEAVAAAQGVREMTHSLPPLIE